MFTLGFAQPPGGAGGDRLPGRGDRPGDRHAADRLPADPVRGVQPQGDRGGAAERAGRLPVLGPELLARTHYALGSGMSTLDTMPDLYAQWERSAADVAESHTTSCRWSGSAPRRRCHPR